MNLELISRNRSSIYGISMLWIMLCHSSFSFSKTWMLSLLIAKNMGNCGVDVFLFVSGISLYFSLSKQNCSLKDFYVHRIKRIVFPTLVTSMLWFGFLAPNPAPDISAFLLDVTGISLFIYGKRTIWFVTMIMICYVVYPLLYSVNKKNRQFSWCACDNSAHMHYIEYYPSQLCAHVLEEFRNTISPHTDFRYRLFLWKICIRETFLAIFCQSMCYYFYHHSCDIYFDAAVLDSHDTRALRIYYHKHQLYSTV